MRTGRLLLAITCLFMVVLSATPAFAYQDEVTDLTKIPMVRGGTPPNPMPCNYCHGSGSTTASPPSAADRVSGPHGGYITSTSKCMACHGLHNASPDNALLLPAATVKATCEVCHDGTGGQGVYGTVKARTGLNPASQHRIDVTASVPGGDASTGGTVTRTFTGAYKYLSCDDCHSPHGAGVVNAFAGDRARSATDGVVANTVTSTRILKKLPTTATTAVTEYGSDWCGGCHKGRLSGSGMPNNHPVESSLRLPTAGSMFYYNNVSRVTGTRVSTTQLGTMGHTNNGYVMPDPRTTDQTGHTPICQQCHEDARHVGDVASYPRQIDTTEVFNITQVDGLATTDSPRFQNFPHESPNLKFLVETNDDLCLNCHNTMILP